MAKPLETARAAWADTLPDWVETLAIEAGKTSQNKVAARLSLSGATVSQVLHNKYAARLDAVEERVRGVFMNALVACPALGTMPTQVCQDWRTKAAAFRTGNPLRNRMYRECHRCPRYRPAPEVADDPA